LGLSFSLSTSPSVSNMAFSRTSWFSVVISINVEARIFKFSFISL
jgi:hypothetical protein